MKTTFFWLVPALVLGCDGQHKRAEPSTSGNERALQVLSESQSSKETTGVTASSEQSVDRKTIYQAELSLAVDDFPAAERALPKLVNEYGGYLADASVDRLSGRRRSGSWTVRVPFEKFDAFLDAAGKLGVAESRRQTAQDVTEEFVDLEARINNSKRVEIEIQKLLESRNGEIKDILAIQGRLGEVRGEIERMEGRMRYLQNRTQLTTVTIHIREEHEYLPPELPRLSTACSAAGALRFTRCKNLARVLWCFS